MAVLSLPSHAHFFSLPYDEALHTATDLAESQDEANGSSLLAPAFLSGFETGDLLESSHSSRGLALDTWSSSSQEDYINEKSSHYDGKEVPFDLYHLGANTHLKSSEQTYDFATNPYTYSLTQLTQPGGGQDVFERAQLFDASLGSPLGEDGLGSPSTNGPESPSELSGFFPQSYSPTCSPQALSTPALDFTGLQLAADDQTSGRLYAPLFSPNVTASQDERDEEMAATRTVQTRRASRQIKSPVIKQEVQDDVDSDQDDTFSPEDDDRENEQMDEPSSEEEYVPEPSAGSRKRARRTSTRTKKATTEAAQRARSSSSLGPSESSGLTIALDAPIQSRTYKTASRTSRKPVPVAIQRNLTADLKRGALVDPTDARSLEAYADRKRRENTIAARASREKKARELVDLREGHVEMSRRIRELEEENRTLKAKLAKRG